MIDCEELLNVAQGGHSTDQGGDSLAVSGYLVRIDSRRLTTPNFNLTGNIHWLVCTQLHELRSLPKTDVVVQGSGRTPEADFKDGEVLQARGLMLGTGTIVDATIIGTPSSTNTADM